MASIWKERSDLASHWYKTGCAPAVDQALATLVGERISLARNVELGRLLRAQPWGRMTTGNPILDEIYDTWNGPEAIKRLIENGGANLSQAAQRAVRMAQPLFAAQQHVSARAPAIKSVESNGMTAQPNGYETADGKTEVPSLAGVLPDPNFARTEAKNDQRNMPHACSNSQDQPALNQETIVSLFPGQKYPKHMYHASKPAVVVNSEREQAELGPDWSETYVHQAYPKCKYHWSGKTFTVKSADEEAALGGGWADTPAAFQPYQGPRKPKTQQHDPTKWVNKWAVSGLTEDVRRKIKAQLLRADAAFWRSPDTPSAFLDPMRQAFIGIAEMLSKEGILTERLLQNELPALVWDSAIAAGWYRTASEMRENIFPERLGNYWVWRDNGTDWNFMNENDFVYIVGYSTPKSRSGWRGYWRTPRKIICS